MWSLDNRTHENGVYVSTVDKKLNYTSLIWKKSTDRAYAHTARIQSSQTNKKTTTHEIKT